MDAEKIPEEWVEAGARALDPEAFAEWTIPPCGLEGSPKEVQARAKDGRQRLARSRSRTALSAVLPMVAAAPGGGKVTREKLREWLDAAFDAGVDAMEKVPAIQETAVRERAEEDALAAALGLEVEG